MLRAKTSRARRLSSGATTDVNCRPRTSPTRRRAASIQPPDDAGPVDHVARDVDRLECRLDVAADRLQLSHDPRSLTTRRPRVSSPRDEARRFPAVAHPEGMTGSGRVADCLQAIPVVHRREYDRRTTTGSTAKEESAMSKPFKGTINIDIKDSTPDWDAVRAAAAAGRRAECALRRPRRRRLLGDGVVRRPDRDAEHQAHRRPRPALHELPHDGALLADALVPADRP